MLGNDIIDIKETKRSSNWERPRFMDKIFTKKEQSIISASVDPFTTVWHLWSMKESAYKVFIQAGGNRFFNPTKIECSLADAKNGQVEIDTIILKTSTLINSNYIFSTATIDTADIDTCIFQLTENNSRQQSNYMHQQVLNDFAKNNCLNREELVIQKTKTGVPILYYKNKPLGTSISITHHGKHGAYSILKN
ncbi:MAG: phosphopantetheinyl transferase (holo-ACP synthase) [Salibacteraceae bacterium]|jgi:phosphopantetheinyl transferase (holo-ACP synthase)